MLMPWGKCFIGYEIERGHHTLTAPIMCTSKYCARAQGF